MTALTAQEAEIFEEIVQEFHTPSSPVLHRLTAHREHVLYTICALSFFGAFSVVDSPVALIACAVSMAAALFALMAGYLGPAIDTP